MKKLFTNDKCFLAVTLLAVIGELGYALIEICMGEYIQSQFTLIFRVACVLCLYISYKKYSKNVMKGMMGALLATQTMTAAIYMTDIDTVVGSVCGPAFLILSLLLFINHFIINADHKASPAMIIMNQILLILLVINNIVWSGYFLLGSNSVVEVLMGILDIFGFIGMTSIVVCVESRLDAYRLDREEAGWTEEKGYPEGYVHEHEKK